VLTNDGSGPAKQIGRLIARIVLGLSLPAVRDLTPPDCLLDHAPGTYQSGEDRLVVTRKGAELWLQGDESPPARLYYQGNDELRTRQDLETTLRFDSCGDRPRLTVVTSGVPTAATRVPR
jgi:hypothetical protein